MDTRAATSFGSWTNSFTEEADFRAGTTSVRTYAGADRWVTSTGTYSTAATVGTSGAWRGQIATFYNAALGAGLAQAQIATGVVAPQALGPGAVLIDPPSRNATVGDYFTVDVMADNVANAGAYDFTLQFDPNVLALSGISNGTLLGSTGRPVSCAPPVVGDDSIEFECISSGSGPGASGSGLLSEVIFRAVAAGTSPLDFTALTLVDSSGEPIAAGTAGGSVSVSASGLVSAPLDAAPRNANVAMAIPGMIGLLAGPVGVRLRGRRNLRSVLPRRMLSGVKSLLRGRR